MKRKNSQLNDDGELYENESDNTIHEVDEGCFYIFFGIAVMALVIIIVLLQNSNTTAQIASMVGFYNENKPIGNSEFVAYCAKTFQWSIEGCLELFDKFRSLE